MNMVHFLRAQKVFSYIQKHKKKKEKVMQVDQMLVLSAKLLTKQGKHTAADSTVVLMQVFGFSVSAGRL